MARPMLQTGRTARQNRSPHHKLTAFPAIALLLFFPGCAQLDQLMGKQTDTVEPAPSAKTVEPAPNATVQEKKQAQAAQPESKPVVKKRSEESRPAGGVKEPPAPAPAPAQPTAPVAGVTKQPEEDKTLSQKEQPPKEKKSRVASDKKSKKSPKARADSQPQTEDVFLPPVPLPSKPAAIGGSGG